MEVVVELWYSTQNLMLYNFYLEGLAKFRHVAIWAIFGGYFWWRDSNEACNTNFSHRNWSSTSFINEVRLNFANWRFWLFLVAIFGSFKISVFFITWKKSKHPCWLFCRKIAILHSNLKILARKFKVDTIWQDTNMSLKIEEKTLLFFSLSSPSSLPLPPRAASFFHVFRRPLSADEAAAEQLYCSILAKSMNRQGSTSCCLILKAIYSF